MNSTNFLKKILIVLAFCILWFCVGYYIIFSNIKSKNEHASRLRDELNLQAKKQEHSLLTGRMIKNVDLDIVRVNSSIISKNGDVAFIESLERQAKDQGLTVGIDSLVFEDDPTFASTTLTSLKITAKTKGTWLGNYKFLAYVESLPFKVKINKFVLVKTPSSWQSAFEIRVLKYK